MRNRFNRLMIKLLPPKKRADYLKEKKIIDIGSGCEIYNDVSFGSEPYLVKIGNKVRVTGGVRFVTHDGGVWVTRNLKMSPDADKMGTITVGNNVFIGLNSIIMPGVKIGSNVIIGAGTVVAKDIADNMVVGGVPAKNICTIEEYYYKNQHRFYNTKHLSYEDKKNFYMNEFKN